MNQFKSGVFKPAIAVVLVLAGCASNLRIHEGLATTTPVTQNRDHAIYDWPSRHELLGDLIPERIVQILK